MSPRRLTVSVAALESTAEGPALVRVSVAATADAARSAAVSAGCGPPVDAGDESFESGRGLGTPQRLA